MALNFAFYGLLLKIRNVVRIGDDVESLPRLFSFYRLSLSLLELSQSRFKVVYHLSIVERFCNVLHEIQGTLSHVPRQKVSPRPPLSNLQEQKDLG